MKGDLIVASSSPVSIPAEHMLQAVSILEGVVIAPVSSSAEDEQWAGWLEAYQLWLESIRRKSNANNSVKAYRIAWTQFFTWAQTTPWDVTPRLAQQWAAWLSHQGKALANGERGPLSHKSVNLKLAAMSSFYQYVQRTTDLWPADRRNPFDSVERYKTDPYGSAEFPSETEAQAILAAINRKVLTGNHPDLTVIDGGTIACQTSQSYTQWVPMHDPDLAQSILPMGQSERPQGLSRLSTRSLWGAGELHPAPLSRKSVEALGVTRIRLRESSRL